MIGRNLLMLAVVLAALVAVPACGDDDGGDVDTSNAQERLLVAQAYFDIDVFCIRANLDSTRQDLQNVGFIKAVTAVNRLVAQRREDPDIVVPLNRQRTEVPFEQVYKETTNRLKRKCGKDGRLVATRLERALAG